MFNTYIFDNKSVKAAARIIADSNREHDETLKSISRDEIKSKDRVDIPLSEYLNMKQELESLNRRVKQMGSLIISMGIPAEVIEQIDPNSVRVETCDDPRLFKRHYRVSFTTIDA